MKEICICTLTASHTLIYDKRCRDIFIQDMFLCVCTNIGVKT